MRKWLYQGKTDEALLASFLATGVATSAAKRELAFECLYLRHKQGLFNFIRRQAGNPAIAEELVQDTWIAVINGGHRFQPKASFKTWLYRIAHNRLIDHWRKYSNGAIEFSGELATELLRQASDGQDSTTRSIELNQLIKSVGVLPGDQLATLLLRIEGFSHAEIAEITQAKAETVKSRLRYATRRLRLAAEVSA